MAKRPLNRKDKRAEHEAYEAREREKEEELKKKKKKAVASDEDMDEEEDDDLDGDDDDLDEDDDEDAELPDGVEDDLDDPDAEPRADEEDIALTRKKPKKAAKVKAAKKGKVKAAAKPKAKKGAKTGPVRAVWVVFGNSQNRVASYPYSQEKEAREHALKLNNEKPEKKGNHFVMMIKEPIE